MSYLTAARHDLDAAESYLGEAHAIAAPLLAHLTEEDDYISKDAQALIKALAGVPSATVYSYPGPNHAYARHTGLHFNAEAAALANGRTVAFRGIKQTKEPRSSTRIGARVSRSCSTTAGR
jgi:carboxymethylenebutenolidase